jgi:hypothetical protein
VRQMTCSTCGTVYRVIKEAANGVRYDTFDCCAGRLKSRDEQPMGQVLSFDPGKRKGVGRGTPEACSGKCASSVSHDESLRGGA